MNKSFKIVYLVGMPGVGKTYLGNYAAIKLQVQFIDLDTVIEQKLQISIADIFESKGEEEFRKIEFETLKQITENCTVDTIIATGGGTPCYNNAMKWMNGKGKTVWLNAGIKFLVDNILNEKAPRPLFKDLKSTSLLNKITEIYSLRRPFYAMSHININVYKGLRPDLFTKRLHLSTFDLED